MRLSFLPLFLMAFIHSACGDIYRHATTGQAQVINPVYFGIHFHRLVLRPQEKAVLTEWPSLSFGSVRLWDSVTRWGDIAPSAGLWNFERLDSYVNQATAHDASVLYTLGSTPRWASARPDEPCPYGFGCAAEPVRMGHWEEYVRRVAQRYGDRIAAYELWNEPYFSDISRDRGRTAFYSGSVSQMVEMARLARKVLDDVSPNAILCTPGFTNGPDRLDMFLAAGGKQYVQAICYHFYSDDSARFVRQIQEVRSLMKRHGVEKLPLWNTETGVEVHTIGDPKTGSIARTREESVSLWSQLLILGAATGLERFYYYAWDSQLSGMVSTNGGHFPGYEVMRHLQTWLLGARLTGCQGIGDAVRCDAQIDQDRFVLAWAKKIDKRSIAIPAGWRVAAIEALVGESPIPVKQAPGELTLVLGPSPVRLVLEPVMPSKISP